jgi:hypothetical protein
MKRSYFFSLLLLSIVSCQKNSSSETNENREISEWMHNVLLAHPDIALSDIAVPGSHDAGTYILQECTTGANTCNTQTQFKNTSEQLIAGLRIFDIRPSFFNNKFYTQHATDCDGLGCKGDQLSNIFSQINSFLDDHNELVILEFSHFCHSSFSDPAFMSLLNTFGNKIYKETAADTVPFIHRMLKNIIPPGSKSGKVMLIYEGAADNPENKANGIFSSTVIPTEGGWTNSHDLSDLLEKQRLNYSNYSNNGSSIFQFSWQITQSDAMAVQCAIYPDTVSIGKLATVANNQLNPFVDTLIANGQVRKGRIPNVIFVDFADEFITRLCIRLNKLNLE